MKCRVRRFLVLLIIVTFPGCGYNQSLSQESEIEKNELIEDVYKNKSEQSKNEDQINSYKSELKKRINAEGLNIGRHVEIDDVGIVYEIIQDDTVVYYDFNYFKNDESYNIEGMDFEIEEIDYNNDKLFFNSNGVSKISSVKFIPFVYTCSLFADGEYLLETEDKTFTVDDKISFGKEKVATTISEIDYNEEEITLKFEPREDSELWYAGFVYLPYMEVYSDEESIVLDVSNTEIQDGKINIFKSSNFKEDKVSFYYTHSGCQVKLKKKDGNNYKLAYKTKVIEDTTVCYLKILFTE